LLLTVRISPESLSKDIMHVRVLELTQPTRGEFKEGQVKYRRRQETQKRVFCRLSHGRALSCLSFAAQAANIDDCFCPRNTQPILCESLRRCCRCTHADDHSRTILKQAEPGSTVSGSSESDGAVTPWSETGKTCPKSSHLHSLISSAKIFAPRHRHSNTLG
jgi:hypothetical protein